MVKVTLSVLFLLTLIPSYTLSSSPIFVLPTQDCSTTCNGDSSTPYNNLFDAFNSATTSDPATIILLSDSSSTPHQLEDPSGSTYTSPTFSFNTLTVKPLFCNDNDLITSYPSISGNCIGSGEKLTISVKTTKWNVLVGEAVSFQGVIFDASEDPEGWNNVASSSVNYETTYPTLASYSQANSLFQFVDTAASGGIPRELYFEGVEFVNFQSPQIKSLVQTGIQPFKLTFNKTVFDHIYFDSGVVYHISTVDNGTLALLNSSMIVMVNSSFANYNDLGLYAGILTRKEGYFVNMGVTFSGVLQIIDSNFSDVVSSLRTFCWPQTQDYYIAPMNNLLTSEPRSRSDLWNQYYQEKGSKSDYVSSLIYVSKIYGGVKISGSSFSNVIGTSGSVIRVDDVLSSGASFEIEDSKFDGNFAYDKFPNIMIAKVSEGTFTSLFACPKIMITNSEFINTVGCPGSYGNIFSLCSWDSSPPSDGLSSYSLSTDSLNSLTVNKGGAKSEDLADIIIKGCLFENNLMAVSNSLAIIGSYLTILEENTFENNGGTSAEIAQVSLEGSYFLQRYPDGLSLITDMTHFGQSTVLFIDHIVRLYSYKNIYKGNWGPWEGSIALGSSVTVKNWVKIDQDVEFVEDYFGDHQGIPSKFSVSNTGLANNVYNAPILTISLDNNAIDALGDSIDIKSPDLIRLLGVSFENNIVSYDYASVTYNIGEVGTLIGSVIVSSLRYQAGLVKLLMKFEALDDFSGGYLPEQTTLSRVSFAFYEGKIQGNHLLTTGCLLSDVSFLDSLYISENEIFIASTDDSYAPSAGDVAYLQNFYNQGVLCIGLNSYTGSISRLETVANNLVLVKNKGILINLFPGTSAALYLTNSIFSGNYCRELSLILARAASLVSQYNNLFLENYDTGSVMYLYTVNMGVMLYNIYLNNTGALTTNLMLETIYTEIFVGMSKAYWNDANEALEMFSLGTLPASGLYGTSAVALIFFNSEFKANKAYGGIIYGFQATHVFLNCEIKDHYIVGSNVIGSFAGVATLVMNNVTISNNTIVRDTTKENLVSGLMVFFTATVDFGDVRIINNHALEGAYLIFGNLVTGSMAGIEIIDSYAPYSSSFEMINLILSIMSVSGLKTSNTTGLFNVMRCTLDFSDIDVRDIVSDYESQFIMNMYDTSIQIKDFNYVNKINYQNPLSSIRAEESNIMINNMSMNDATTTLDPIFKLKSNKILHISGSTFIHTAEKPKAVLFDLSYSETVVIENSIFWGVATIMQADMIVETIGLIGNTIVTNSYMQSMMLTDISAPVYLVGNHFVDPREYVIKSPVTAQIQLENCLQEIVMSQNTLISLIGESGVVQIWAETSYYNATFDGNIFVNNSAIAGGAIFLYDSHGDNSTNSLAKIKGSLFIGNKAATLDKTDVINPGRGGAIYQAVGTELVQETEVLGSVFINNEADIAGGAIFFNYSVPSFDSSCYFKKNIAGGRANHISSYPVQVVLSSDDQVYPVNSLYVPGTATRVLGSVDYNWDAVSSGTTTRKTYQFMLIDIFNQVVFSDNESKLAMQFQDSADSAKYQLTDTPTITASGGIYTLKDFTFNYQPGQKTNIVFTSSGIPSFSQSPVTGLNFVSNLTVSANFRLCGIGEYVEEDGGNVRCEECPASFWQLDPITDVTVCSPCDAESMICLGGNNVGPRKGYWRMNATADIVIKCSIEEACLGNDISEESGANVELDITGSCGEGYKGNACSSCEPGWAQDMNNNCVKCSKSFQNYIIFVLLILLQGAWIAYCTKQALKLTKEYGKNIQIRSKTVTLLRIFMNYYHTFSIIMMISVNWSIQIKKILLASTRLSTLSDQLFYINCVFSLGGNLFGVKTVFVRSLFEALEPVFFIFGAAIFWIVFFRSRNEKALRNKEYYNRLSISTIVICYYFTPNIINNILALFQCKNIYRNDDPKFYMVQDYQVLCWGPEHLHWIFGIAIPALVVYLIVLPGATFWYLKKNKKSLGSVKVAKKCSFIYHGTRKTRYYWELIILAMKVLISSTVVLSGPAAASQRIFLSSVILFIMMFMFKINKPFTNSGLNRVGLVGIQSLFLISFCGMYFQMIGDIRSLNTIVSIIAGFSNIFFVKVFCEAFFAKRIAQLKNTKVYKKMNAWLGKSEFVRKVSMKYLSSKTKEIEMTIPEGGLIALKSMSGELDLKSMSGDLDCKSDREPTGVMMLPVLSEGESMREDGDGGGDNVPGEAEAGKTLFTNEAMSPKKWRKNMR